MMNPEMMRAATEMMKNMRKEDLEAMTRQMQNMPSMPGMGGPGTDLRPLRLELEHAPMRLRMCTLQAAVSGLRPYRPFDCNQPLAALRPAGMPSPAMAAEMMKNMRPEDLQFMARQMESMPPEQLQRMAAQMGSGQAGPGGAGAMPLDASAVSGAARVLQQRQRYELDAAVRLKEEVHGPSGVWRCIQHACQGYQKLGRHATALESREQGFLDVEGLPH